MLKSNLCPRCGEPLSEEGGKLVCRYCHASYTVDEGEKAKKLLLSVIEEAKLEALANRRRILWEAAHKPHISTKEIRRAASDVREIYAEDRLARFYLSAVSNNPSDLNDFLLNEEVDLFDAREMVRFILLSLDLRNVLAVRNFVEKHFSGKEKLDNLQRVSDETEKLDQGVYLTSLPRHVFLAYSSADMDDVIRIADYLEEQGITCFVASRNLRHGKGSVENYEKALYDALSHCSCLVFVSSENSRSLSCDALTVELPFAQDNLPKLKRIQYVIEEPGKKTGPAVKTLLKSYFQGEEWITDLETLSEKVALCLVRKDKVCLHCHAINPAEATHCHKCGYPLDKAAYDKRVSEERKQQEALAKLAEIEKKQSERKAEATSKPSIDNWNQRRAERLTERKEEHKPAPKVEPAKPSPKPIEPSKPIEKPKEPTAPLAPQKSKNQLIQEQMKADMAKDIEKRKAEGREAFPFHSLDVKHVVDREHRGVNWESVEFTAPVGLSVGVEAFMGCPFLKTIKFPVIVGSIWSHAFAKNPSLEYVTLPGTVTSLGVGIFEDCPKLHKVMIPANNSFSVFENSMFKRCKSIETLPMSQLKIIRSYALQDCEKLASVKSEVGITEVGDCAFKNCKNLADIGKNVPLQKVGWEAFRDCVKLKSTIHLSHSAQVGSAAFSGCSMDIVIEGKKPLFGLYPKGFDSKWLDGFQGTVRYSDGKTVFGNGGQFPSGSKLAKKTLTDAERDKLRDKILRELNGDKKK